MRLFALPLLIASIAFAAGAAPAAAATELVMGHDGHVRAVEDPYGAARGFPESPPGTHDRVARHGAPVARAASARTRARLRVLLRSGAIDQPAYDRAAGAYDAAISSLGRLRGQRRAQLRAVVADVDGIAARGMLSAGRLPAISETLERNRSWWTRGPLLAPGRRVSFAGSELVWQHYADQGIQIQWLGTFGRANGLFQSGDHDPQLKQLLDEAIGLASPRAGGIAWEYLFGFDGGSPPWVSGLSQGTALSALSRGAVRLATPAYFEAARSALGIFRAPAPQGVADATTAGTHYLQYSFAPRLRILNGFVQSLNGLHDFAALANDDDGRALFAAGDAEARAELPRYDTGGWSRYSQFRDSDVAYHELLRDFLRGLCKRLVAEDPSAPYCAVADAFTADLHTPPRIVIVAAARAPRQRSAARLRFTLDKPATVTFSVRRAGFARTTTARFGSGAHAFAWRPPRAGPYRVALRGVDLVGNAATVTGDAHVRR